MKVQTQEKEFDAIYNMKDILYRVDTIVSNMTMRADPAAEFEMMQITANIPNDVWRDGINMDSVEQLFLNACAQYEYISRDNTMQLNELLSLFITKCEAAGVDLQIFLDIVDWNGGVSGRFDTLPCIRYIAEKLYVQSDDCRIMQLYNSIKENIDLLKNDAPLISVGDQELHPVLVEGHPVWWIFRARPSDFSEILEMAIKNEDAQMISMIPIIAKLYDSNAVALSDDFMPQEEIQIGGVTLPLDISTIICQFIVGSATSEINDLTNNEDSTYSHSSSFDMEDNAHADVLGDSNGLD